jgi:hypothetical protein
MPLEVILQRADQALAQERRYKLVGLVTASLLLACFGLFSWWPNQLSQIGPRSGLSAGLSMAWRAYRLRERSLCYQRPGIDYRRILQRELKRLPSAGKLCSWFNSALLCICWATPVMT